MGPVAVLADIHGNVPAFRAVIGDVVSEGCAKSYVLGDIVNHDAQITAATIQVQSASLEDCLHAW